MFSKKCEYAIKATIFIAAQSLDHKRVSLKEIAHEIDSPEAFTAKILQSLVKPGIIHSAQGSTGGYEIPLKQLKELSLSNVITALDGPKHLSGCALGLKQCSDDIPCPFHDKWKVVRSLLNDILKTTMIYELALGIKDMKTILKY